MSVYKLVRYHLRPEALLAAEQLMRDHATYVRATLPGTIWTVYRDRTTPTLLVAMVRATDEAADRAHDEAEGTRTFAAALAPLLAAPVDDAAVELVTSSDLAPRHRLPPARRRGR